jgi:hypothetical protein
MTTGRDDRRDADDGLESRDAELAQRARAAFEREAEALDAATRRRLAAARRAALDELEVRGARHAAPDWMPVGAAAVAVAAVGVALTVRGPQPTPGADGVAAGVAISEPTSEMELLLGEEDLGMFAEDPEFVAWAVAQDAGVVAPEGSDDAG